MANLFNGYLDRGPYSPAVTDNLNRMKSFTGFSDMLSGGPLPNSSPAEASQYYGAKVGLGLADLIKSPIALGAQIPEAADWFFSKPQQELAAASQTAASATAPTKEEVAQKQVEDTKKTKATQEAQIQQALLNQAKSGGGGKGVKDGIPMAMPTLDTGENKTSDSGNSDEDISKAMLRAGIAMMQSKGDIWDALGAGFAGYQDTLDEKDKKEAEAAKEAREFGLEKYKADIYNAQTMGNLALASRKGAGGSEDDNYKGKKYQLDVMEYQLKAQQELNKMAEQSRLARLSGDIAGANSLDYDIYRLGVQAGIIAPPKKDETTGEAVASDYKKQP
jgi:hypothetical protein